MENNVDVRIKEIIFNFNTEKQNMLKNHYEEIKKLNAQLNWFRQSMTNDEIVSLKQIAFIISKDNNYLSKKISIIENLLKKRTEINYKLRVQNRKLKKELYARCNTKNQ